MEITGRRFVGKVALITGAASGIGRATALRLAGEGAKVAICDVDVDGLAETARTVDEAYGDSTALAIVGSVAEPADVERIVAETVATFGAIDTLCNIAGILKFHNFAEITLEDWNRIMSVNVTGSFLMSQAALPHLLDGGGSIVLLSSTAALAGHPWAAAYSASKGAIDALTKTLAVEFGRRGVRTNAIAPGSIDTPIQNAFHFPEGADESLLYRIMPLDRSRGPEYIASAIAFAASEDGGHMNGATLRVDSGTLS